MNRPSPGPIVLGSQSSRRLELLRQIVPPERITVLPPDNAAEPGFEGLNRWDEIEEQLLRVAALKNRDVRAQLGQHPLQDAIVLTADTVIVGEIDAGGLIVLGKPPDNETWRETVRDWFLNYYQGKKHHALTGVCLTKPDGNQVCRVVQSAVSFHHDIEHWLDWYLDTGESQGKAGGYAIQGAGSLFVTAVNGSLSNVIGLPLIEVWELLDSVGFYDSA